MTTRNISTLEAVYSNMADIPGLPDAYQPRNIAVALEAMQATTPASPEPFCVDEGCDHYGTLHICRQPTSNVRRNQMTFDPTQNRTRIDLMTEEELAALKSYRYGWEVYSGGKWINILLPSWASSATYRAKPAPAPTILCNGVEVPEPVRETLKYGEAYWVVSTSHEALCSELTWTNARYDHLWLSRGLIHRTKETATAHGQAMIKGAGE